MVFFIAEIFFIKFVADHLHVEILYHYLHSEDWSILYGLFHHEDFVLTFLLTIFM